MIYFLLLTGILVGAALGLRFKVFVLVPATAVALGIVAVGQIAYGQSLGRIAIAMIAIAASIQIGYIGGIVIRFAAGAKWGRHSDDAPDDDSARHRSAPGFWFFHF